MTIICMVRQISKHKAAFYEANWLRRRQKSTKTRTYTCFKWLPDLEPPISLGSDSLANCRIRYCNVDIACMHIKLWSNIVQPFGLHAARRSPSPCPLAA